MKLLENNFSRKGVHYELLARTPKVAFYRCRYDRTEAVAVWYEVFSVTISSVKISGDPEMYEVFPSDESFGTKIKATTFFGPGSESRAIKAFESLVDTKYVPAEISREIQTPGRKNTILDSTSIPAK